MSIYTLMRKLAHSSMILQSVMSNIRKRLEKQRVMQFHKVGYTVNSIVHEALKSTQYRYFALAGTLLGIIREGQFIAYDDDLDYGIMIEDNNTWNEFYHHMKEKGFKLEHFFVEENVITELTFSHSGISIDFYGMQYKEDHLLSCAYYRKKDQRYEKHEASTMHVIYPLLAGIKIITCHESEFPIPVNSEEFLENNYGTSWKTPIKNINVESKTGTRQFFDNKISFYYSSPLNGSALL